MIIWRNASCCRVKLSRAVVIVAKDQCHGSVSTHMILILTQDILVSAQHTLLTIAKLRDFHRDTIICLQHNIDIERDRGWQQSIVISLKTKRRLTLVLTLLTPLSLSTDTLIIESCDRPQSKHKEQTSTSIQSV